MADNIIPEVSVTKDGSYILNVLNYAAVATALSSVDTNKFLNTGDEIL